MKKKKSLNRGYTKDKDMEKRGACEVDNSKFRELDEEYTDLVNLVSKKNLDFDVSNSSIDHAKYLVQKLFEKTNKEFDIFIKSSDLDILSCIDNSINKKNINVKVLLDNPTDSSKIKLKEIFSNFNLKFKEAKKINEKLPYFIVSDSKRFRISSRSNGNRGLANFNKPSFGGILSREFSSSWGCS